VPPTTSRPRGRRPGPSRTREDILAAARAAFAEDGFAGGTVRAIARRAGVDPALVIQFFGSKDELFAAAMELPFAGADVVARVLDGPRDQLGARMVTAFLDLWDDPQVGPRMLGLLRSAATHEAAARRLRELVEGQILGPVAASLDVPDAPLRAELVGSQLVGLGFARYVLGLEPLRSADRETLVRLLAPTVQQHLAPRQRLRPFPGGSGHADRPGPA
jgi:AcrR family transcriptional regulator